MGKGGVNGQVSLPPYLEDQHGLWLQGLQVDTGGGSTWSGGVPQAPSKTLLQVMNTAFGSNPWNSAAYIDPTAIFANSQTRLSEYDARLALVNDQTDWAARVASAVTKVDQVGVLKNLGIDVIHDTARSEANDQLISALVQKSSVGISELSNWETFIQGVKNKLDSAGILNDIVLDDIITIARDSATTEVTAAKGVTSGISEETYWLTLVDVVVNKVNECGFIKEIEMPALVQQAAIQARTQIEEIVSTVNDLIDWGRLDDLVASYEDSTKIQRAKVVRTFTGAMSDIEAVNGSAFLMGLSQIYSQFSQDTNRFRAERAHELFRELLQAQVQSILGQISASVQVKIANKQSRDNVLMQAISSMLGMFAQRIQFDQLLAQLHSLTHRDIVGAGSQIETAVKGSRDSLIGQSVQSVQQLLNARVGYEQSMMQLHSQIFAGSVEAQLRAGAIEKGARDNLMSQGTQQMHMALFERLRMDIETARLQGEFNRVKYVGLQEYKKELLEVEVRKSMWDMEVFQSGSHILAAPTGTSAALPHGPSRAASTLGGAVQGGALGAGSVAALAAAGVATGGIALPIIAGAALLGGMGGLLQ